MINRLRALDERAIASQERWQQRLGIYSAADLALALAGLLGFLCSALRVLA
jgi:hypothetical protein